MSDGHPGAGVVLVTGASAGIGAACCDRLQQAGWTVIGASRRGTSIGAWAPMVMDVDSDEAVTSGVAAVRERHGGLDAVVAAAGFGLAGPVEHTSTAEARAQLETNFFGVDRVVRAALPSMRAGGGGRLVLVGSIGGMIGLPFQAYYSASKFALEGYAEALAHEVAPFGLRVTVVEPGNVRTHFTASRRDVEAPAENPYRQATAKAISTMERDEANGVPADEVARVIERVLLGRRPPRRVSVGKPGERVGILAKRLLPYRVFERAAKGSLGV